MTLKDIINRLQQEPADKVISAGFILPHAYTHDIGQLAFNPTSIIPVHEIISAIEESIGKVFNAPDGANLYVMIIQMHIWQNRDKQGF